MNTSVYFADASCQYLFQCNEDVISDAFLDEIDEHKIDVAGIHDVFVIVDNAHSVENENIIYDVIGQLLCPPTEQPLIEKGD